MNNRILTFVLVVGIASTGFAGISAANSGTTLGEIKTKVEQGQKKMFQKGNHFGKRKGLKHLTDDEKTALESMSDEEKESFFASKKAEKEAQKEVGKQIIQKLMTGETLTAQQEATRLEMLANIEDGKHKRNNADVIAKLLAGDELTEAEQVELIEMQEKHDEREAQRAIIEPIKAKLDAGEELTDEEQTLFDEMKGSKKGKGKKGHGKRNDTKRGEK